MAIRLEKGQRINLEKETGAKLTNFCVKSLASLVSGQGKRNLT